MDISAIVTAAITILSPYLAKAGEEAAKKVGSAAWEKATEIHQAIKARFKKEEDSYPAQTLEQFEKDPEKRKGAMEDVLKEIMEQDTEFSARLLSLLEEADEAGAGAVFNVNIFGGEVGEILSIDKLEGGLTIDKRSRKTVDKRSGK
jgi:hypothetical protein